VIPCDTFCKTGSDLACDSVSTLTTKEASDATGTNWSASDIEYRDLSRMCQHVPTDSHSDLPYKLASMTILSLTSKVYSTCRKINQQYVYGDIAQIEALQEAQLQVYTPNTKFWWRLAELVYAPSCG
jgi:hypothetical protein